MLFRRMFDHDPCSRTCLLVQRAGGMTLLIRGTGHIEFQAIAAAARQDRPVSRLRQRSLETLVNPAHDYHGTQVSRIGVSRRPNPRLHACACGRVQPY